MGLVTVASSSTSPVQSDSRPQPTQARSESAPGTAGSPSLSTSSLNYYDAHNHLQDARLGDARAQEQLVKTCLTAGLKRMVVNGSCEEDWPEVAALARRFPCVLPSFGYHPWYVAEATCQWKKHLTTALDSCTSVIGEIGLDRWIPNPDLALQEELFVEQLRMAVERDLPVSIHCLKAWGWLEEILKRETRPSRGFLLHSYGGPVEMVKSMSQLGAYFSFPGYYLHERKARQRETFQSIPIDRLLVETDSPDQLLPDALNRHPMTSATDVTVVNHPANIVPVYEGLAKLRGISLGELTERVEENFRRLFL